MTEHAAATLNVLPLRHTITSHQMKGFQKFFERLWAKHKEEGRYLTDISINQIEPIARRMIIFLAYQDWRKSYYGESRTGLVWGVDNSPDKL